MSDLVLWIALLFAFAATVASVRLGGPASALRYLRRKENRMIRNGVLMFVGAGAFVALVSTALAEEKKIEWFPTAELFIGVDYPMLGRISPQCVPEGPDNKITSHGGFRGTIARRGRVSLVGQLTHHSCGFNEDRNLYDAAGLHAVWKLW